jgi:hypothetical protein
MAAELEFIKQLAPYLMPFFGVLALIIFVKRYLFADMMSSGYHKEQMDRERMILTHYQNVTVQLSDIILTLRELSISAKEAKLRMEELATSIDDSVVHQILRLSEEERQAVRLLRNRPPILTAEGA